MHHHPHTKQKLLKPFFSTLLVIELFLAAPALAAKIPSPSQVAAELENRYHLNLQSIQNQGESFNVSDTKKVTPEVSLFFSPTDPRPGQKLSARAFPMYFSNTEDSLYYTWYLKREDCTDEECDYDDDGEYDENDWKIEAMRIIAQNGYDSVDTDYDSDSDSDGYRAKFGGDGKVNTPDYCYVHDNDSGVNYELAEDPGTGSAECTGGTVMCVVSEQQVGPGTLSLSSSADGGDAGSGGSASSSASGETFVESTGSACHVSGYPACSSSGVPSCALGTPVCITDTSNLTSCGTAVTTCSVKTRSQANPYCRHLFADVPDHVSGDGSFGADEEEFWGTDPNDPDTADNGNKDEANTVGLGQSVFTWNYESGDEVGVAVEGAAMIATKYGDSSSMIMWALPKKNCPISLADERGSFVENIRGYNVVIPAADIDLNKCIEKNLVDPTEGGQATRLDVSVAATPDNPLNDETGDKSGDVVAVQASVSNGGRNIANTLFDWTVEMSNNSRFSNAGSDAVADVTGSLRALGLIGNTKGNALDTVRLKLDIPRGTVSEYLDAGGTAYLRFKVSVTENFASGVTRKGRSDVIVKFVSTGKKIAAYKADPVPAGGAMHVKLPSDLSGGTICNQDASERSVCRVIRNEIVGLRIDPSGLSSFKWTVNGAPLTCTRSGVSPDCTDGEQNETNFFPVSGNVGDTYTVTVTANDVSSGKALTLSRTFHIVAPEVSIVSADASSAWPKLLGQYRDITGNETACPGGLCNDYSRSILQAFSGSTIALKAGFLPGFLGTLAQKEWTVDGETVAETGPGEIRFAASKFPPNIYNVSLAALVQQNDEVRRALSDIWSISQFDSPEIRFAVTNQIELQDPNLSAEASQGQKKFFAALSSYIPASVLFSFRILLSAALILFTTGFLFALIPEQSRSMRE